MGTELQKKLIPLFHYALNPGGMLFLGTSESVGEFSELFSTLDSKAKLYLRKQGFHGTQRIGMSRFLPSQTPLEPGLALPPDKLSGKVKVSLRDLTEQALLKHLGLCAALINGKGDILYLHGRSGMYLEPPAGETGINNLLKMAREGLQRELTTNLHRAVVTKNLVRVPHLRVKTNGHFTTVNLTIRPLETNSSQTTTEPLLYLVILEEATALHAPVAPGHDPAPAAHVDGPATAPLQVEERGFDRHAAAAIIAALNDELHTTKEYLQAANEELETSNEELKSSNEEMQSINEELQSANEELETSKEEMQSINEELATVNSELQTKVADLSRSSNDMNNLLAGTDIGTIFVDHQQHILRFTPAATRIINLIPSDVGRPVAHTVSNLTGYTNLVADTQSVLNTLMPKIMDVQTTEGSWYTMRILPYRTVDNVIEGAAITFVDITDTVRTREALRKANDLARLAVVVRDAHDAITVQDLDGRILAWNPGAVRMYGWSEAEALDMNARDRIPPELRESSLSMIHKLTRAEILEPYRTQRIAKDGSVVEVYMTSTALVNEAQQMYAIATTERALESAPVGAANEQHDR